MKTMIYEAVAIPMAASSSSGFTVFTRLPMECTTFDTMEELLDDLTEEK